MATKRFKANVLSQSSIEALKKQLIDYQNSLQHKCELIVDGLMEIGEKVALQKIEESIKGNIVTFQSEMTPEEAGCRAVMFAVGKVKQVEGREPFNLLFAVEFGAGIHYNKKEHPKAAEHGMGVGSYPGQTHAMDDGGWYYMDNDGNWHHSYGIKATMPMYNAAMSMVSNVTKVAKEVFK